MKEPIRIETITGPAFLASALVNGDKSGLDEQGLRELDHFLAYAEGYEIFDVARDADGDPQDPRFTWSYGLYGGLGAQGGEVLDYAAYVAAEHEED